MCTGHVQENCMGHTHEQQHEERFSNFSKHVLHQKELIQEHPDLGMNTFSLDLYPNMVFKAIIFHCLRSREPYGQMYETNEIQGMGTK